MRADARSPLYLRITDARGSTQSSGTNANRNVFRIQIVLVLKIAYLINQYPKASHSFIRREILALERQGFEVQRIAVRGWDDPLPDAEDRREREQTRYVLRQGLWALLAPTIRALMRSPARFCAALRLAVKMAHESDRPLPYHLVYVAEACRILPWLRGFGARRIHAHFGNNSTEIAMLAHVLGGPSYSFTIHGPGEFQQPMGLDEKIRRSAFTVAVSSYGRSQACLRSRHEDWTKIKIIHCGLEKAFYDIAATPVAMAPRFVCVGRLCEEKGQLVLIEAAACLVAKCIPFQLVLAGDGPMRGELEKLIAKYELGRQIRITGWISSSDVRDEILAARALILPSFAEGLPVVIMEAMALRRPVITTYVAGIPELVRANEDGWLIPAGSVDDLVTAMEECLGTSPENLQRIGNAAHRRVTARHSIDIETAKLAVLLRTAESGQ
jgi:colanic acid/amylovoran biosynthesis glycosyltransferase